MQERERELQRQRHAELERRAAERREIRRLSKTFAITLEGSLLLDIPPKVLCIGTLPIKSKKLVMQLVNCSVLYKKG